MNEDQYKKLVLIACEALERARIAEQKLSTLDQALRDASPSLHKDWSDRFAHLQRDKSTEVNQLSIASARQNLLDEET